MFGGDTGDRGLELKTIERPAHDALLVDEAWRLFHDLAFVFSKNNFNNLRIDLPPFMRHMLIHRVDCKPPIRIAVIDFSSDNGETKLRYNGEPCDAVDRLAWFLWRVDKDLTESYGMVSRPWPTSLLVIFGLLAVALIEGALLIASN